MKKLFFLALIFIAFNSCSKDDNPQPEMELATVVTAEVTNVSQTTATSGGNVTDDGGNTVTARGICYSTTPSPTIANNPTNDGTGEGVFTNNLTGLTAGTNYYLRAYATNGEGTAYGNEEEFTTLDPTPIITSVLPLEATLGTETIFTVTGTNLSEGMDFGITDLVTIIEVTGGNSTTRSFKGMPSGLTGTKKGVIRDASGVSDLFSFQVTFKNGFTIETISVAGGTFEMGSEDGAVNEKPIHEVTLSSFEISKYEITNGQYADYINAINANANGSVGSVEYLDIASSSSKISHNGSQFVVGAGKAHDPVIDVSWYGAKAYCEYYGGRLPTEAEWEFAARGGNSSGGSTYSGSNTIDDVAWYSGNSGGATHPVGTKNANEIGLHDMTGNVWEWCNDWYGSDYYMDSPSSNPQGPASGTFRVNRGGSWSSGAINCRIAFRSFSGPADTFSSLGFRPVFVP